MRQTLTACEPISKSVQWPQIGSHWDFNIYVESLFTNTISLLSLLTCRFISLSKELICLQRWGSALNDNFCEWKKKLTWWLYLLSAASCEEWRLMLFPASVSLVWKGEKQHRRIEENNTLTLGLHKTHCEHSQMLLLISAASCVLHFSYSSAQLHTQHWHPALRYQVD